MSSTPRATWWPAVPAVLVAVDPNQAIMLGSTTAQIAADVRNVLVGQSLGSISVAGAAPLAIVLKVDSSTATSIEGLKALPVGTAVQAPLGSVADVSEVATQGSVTRVDGAPAATISGDIVTNDEGAVSRAVNALITELEASGAIPAGVSVELAGVSQQQGQAFGSLFLSMGVAILLVYLVMVLLFGSLIDPLVILFSLPLATIGAFPALLISGQSIGISALIGFLMLIGIVVTNAIVLLDLVEQLRHKGYSTYDALIQGGRTRVRPILMTAVATILALAATGARLLRWLGHRVGAGRRGYRRAVQLHDLDPGHRARGVYPRRWRQAGSGPPVRWRIQAVPATPAGEATGAA